MDVHDLARAIHRAWAKTTHDRPMQWAKIADAYRDAADLLPLIEAHTRAAVEEERAACEAVAREHSLGRKAQELACINQKGRKQEARDYQTMAIEGIHIASAIAARKKPQRWAALSRALAHDAARIAAALDLLERVELQDAELVEDVVASVQHALQKQKDWTGRVNSEALGRAALAALVGRS